MHKNGLFVLSLLSTLALVSCTTGESSSNANETSSLSSASSSSADKASSSTTSPETTSAIVEYFSATNHTEAVAQTIASHIGSALYELEPVDPYTSADLNDNDRNSRVS